MMKKSSISKRRKTDTFLTILVFVIAVIVVLPFLWVLMLSFKTDNQILTNPLSLPESLSLTNYIRAFNTLPLLTMYKNTMILVFFTQAIGLLFTFMSSFAIARLHFRSEGRRNALYLFILAGQIIPAYILLFPIYRINTIFKLVDTYASLILPLTATSISFNTLLFVGFLNDFPEEIEEAAIIDGCSLFQLCSRIVIPIIKPVFATILVFNVLYVWNEYPISVTLINKASMYTIALGASLFKGQYSMDYSGLVAGTVLIIIPQLIFYAFFQKNIIEGMTAGAVKG